MIVRVRDLAVAVAVAFGLVGAGCTFVKNEEQTEVESGGVDVFFNDASFNPDKMARDIWGEQVIPYLRGKAGDFSEVIELVASDPDEAGSRFGYREQAEGTPWTIVTRLEGEIVAATADTRAATIDVDVDGDTSVDATVQIGPVVRGTALRDSLDFITFGDFTNQIDYAKFGKSLNSFVVETELSDVPRDDLVGMHVSVLGVFVLEGAVGTPLITVAEITVGEGTE